MKNSNGLFHRLLWNLDLHRWLIPLAISALGIGYTVWETVLSDHNSITSEQAVMGFLLLGLIAPALAFTTMTWAAQGAQYWEDAQRASERQRQHLLTLNQLGVAVNQTLELQQVLNQAIDHILEAMGQSFGEIYLLEAQVLKLGAARAVSADLLRSPAEIPLDQSECSQRVIAGEMLETRDLQNDSALSASACGREGYASLVCVPVRTAERVIGVIHLASVEQRQFDAEERALLTSMGYLVGTAVEKAQLHAELVELNQELEARVTARTTELVQAKEELAEKAQVLTQVLTAERQVEEKTRAQIAGDLHDGVQQLIVGALYEIQSALDASPENRRAVPARLFAAQELLRRMEMEMRSVIQSLHPVALDAQGLVPAVREFAARFERISKVECVFKAVGAPRRFAPEVEVAAFRIAQEALHNAEVHARAHRVIVALELDPSTLTLAVRDDGVGFDARAIQADTRAHLGLIGMRERAASVGGTLEIDSGINAGTRVTLRVPITVSAQRVEMLSVL